MVASTPIVLITHYRQLQDNFDFASYPELVNAAILKGFTMHTQKDNRVFLGRRKFILATFMLPFLVGNIRTGSKIWGANPLSSSQEDEFVILGGWVLLKDDLVDGVS